MSRKHHNSTSMSLLELAQDWEDDAWRELTDRYGPLVYHWARKAGLSPDDSADLVQDVFRSVVGGLPRFRKESPSDRFRAWLWSITRNKIVDFARVGRNKIRATGGTTANQCLAHLVADSGTDERKSGAHAPQLLAKIEVIKSSFKSETWDAFWRVTIDERDPRVVADELNISVASVYQAKSRVLRRLRSEFGALDWLNPTESQI